MKLVLEPIDPSDHDRQVVRTIDQYLYDARGLLRAVSASYIDGLEATERQALRVWYHERAVYSFPTTELVDWLRTFVGERTALEVGAGHGGLGRALGIHRTDSWIQREAEMAAYYATIWQPALCYPFDVEPIDAVTAVRRYHPQVVIGCWVTHGIDPALPFPPGGGSIHGLCEEQILDHPSVEAYVVVGHRRVHAHKPLLQRPHTLIEAPWIKSRAFDQGNCLFVWHKDALAGEHIRMATS